MADRNDEGRKPDHKKSSDDPRAPFGRGMTSPDSTQVPLSAETGEPDEEAIRGRSGQRPSGRPGSDASDSSSRKR